MLVRGRRPSWRTAPENAASLRVAATLGFTLQRRDRRYLVDTPVPEHAGAPAPSAVLVQIVLVGYWGGAVQHCACARDSLTKEVTPSCDEHFSQAWQDLAFP